MTDDLQSTARHASSRKAILATAAGGVIGFVVSFGVGAMLNAGLADAITLSSQVALFTGALYCVLGLGVLAGVLSPGLGARFLNVEDEGELREMRAALVNSCLAMALWGAALFVLALAAPGPVAPAPALVLAATALAAGAWLARRSYLASDELMAAVTREANSLTALLVFAVMGGWGAVAHAGFVPAPAAIDLVTAFFVLGLAATFVAVARRGMLKAR